MNVNEARGISRMSPDPLSYRWGLGTRLPAGGVHAMNNVVLTKWRNSTKYNIGVLENH